MQELDVLVIGGGPVGLAASIHAAQAGLRVRVLEARGGVVDKACGEGLMPGAVQAMQRMGVDPARSASFTGIRYVDGPSEAVADFSAGPGLGVRRLALHRALGARAEALGVERVEERAPPPEPEGEGVRVGRHRARYLLAADGLRSPIRQALGLGMPILAPPRMGLRRHFSMSPAPRRVEVHWSPWAEAYVTPVAEDEVGLAFLWRPDRLPLDGRPPWERLLQGFPGLAERLGEVRSPLAGAGPFEQRARAVQRGPVLLLGDAAGYLDPLTGEGLRLGFAGAEAAVGCLLRNRPQDYGAQHARILRRYWWMTSALLGLSGWGFSRRLLVPLCQRLPSLMRLAVNALSEGA